MNSRIAKRLRRLTALLLLTAFLLSMFASGASAASARTKAAYLGPMATPFDGTFGAMFPGASPDRKTKLLLKTIDAIPDGAASRFVVTYGAPGLRNFTWAATEEGERLTRAMDALDGFPLDFVMLDLTTGRGIAYLPDETMYSASCMKGPYVAAVCQYQTSRVTASWQKQMRLAIVESDNSAYSTVHKKYGTKGMAKLMETAGVDSFDPSTRHRMQTCVYHGNLPWLAVLVMYDHVIPPMGEVKGDITVMQKIICKPFFDHMLFVSGANDKFIKPVIRIFLHDMPEDWFPANLQHGLGSEL